MQSLTDALQKKMSESKSKKTSNSGEVDRVNASDILTAKQIREATQEKLMHLFKGYVIMSTHENFSSSVTASLRTPEGKPYYLDKLLLDVADIISMREVSHGKKSQRETKQEWLMVLNWMSTGVKQAFVQYKSTEDNVDLKKYVPDLQIYYNNRFPSNKK